MIILKKLLKALLVTAPKGKKQNDYLAYLKRDYAIRKDLIETTRATDMLRNELSKERGNCL